MRAEEYGAIARLPKEERLRRETLVALCSFTGPVWLSRTTSGSAIHRKLGAQTFDFSRDARNELIVRRRLEHVGHQVGDELRLELGHTARRHRRRTDADSARDERLLRIARNRVLVDREVSASERCFRLATRDVLAPEVDKEQMAVGTAGDDSKTALLHD